MKYLYMSFKSCIGKSIAYPGYLGRNLVIAPQHCGAAVVSFPLRERRVQRQKKAGAADIGISTFAMGGESQGRVPLRGVGSELGVDPDTYVLQEADFEQSVVVPALRVPKLACNKIVSILRGHMLDIPRVRCALSCTHPTLLTRNPPKPVIRLQCVLMLQERVHRRGTRRREAVVPPSGAPGGRFAAAEAGCNP